MSHVALENSYCIPCTCSFLLSQKFVSRPTFNDNDYPPNLIQNLADVQLPLPLMHTKMSKSKVN